MKISQNKIIITGASDGIGKALTLKLLSLDNEIIAVGRSQEKLNHLAQFDSRIIPFVCDISQDEELNKLVNFIEQNHRDANILINNAGIQYNYDFSTETDIISKIEHEIATNLTAPIKLLARLKPTLEANPNAAVVNVSSGLGIVPKKQAPIYCGTKAGLHIFTKAFRYQSDRLKVFEIIPPLVDTAMTHGRGSGKISPEALADEFIEAFKKDKYEINIGKVKLLRIINRIAPKIADLIMKNGL
ncbi:MAG: SDR family oxidoreductase [Spirosomataceae bacterium]